MKTIHIMLISCLLLLNSCVPGIVAYIVNNSGQTLQVFIEYVPKYYSEILTTLPASNMTNEKINYNSSLEFESTIIGKRIEDEVIKYTLPPQTTMCLQGGTPYYVNEKIQVYLNDTIDLYIRQEGGKFFMNKEYSAVKTSIYRKTVVFDIK